MDEEKTKQESGDKKSGCSTKTVIVILLLVLVGLCGITVLTTDTDDKTVDASGA